MAAAAPLHARKTSLPRICSLLQLYAIMIPRSTEISVVKPRFVLSRYSFVLTFRRDVSPRETFFPRRVKVASATSAAAAAVTEKSNCGEAQSRCGRGFGSRRRAVRIRGRRSTWNSCLVLRRLACFTLTSRPTLGSWFSSRETIDATVDKITAVPHVSSPPPPISSTIRPILLILFIYFSSSLRLSPLPSIREPAKSRVNRRPPV